ncbi:hypothetical protein SAMD00023353_0401210 [Rosellinia necatrix]|uniref:Extracellular membrane protein CFEM domain-containing protein n=1 Tax=Rosellinia necatrix TaxID=77044 RepID=A0A1S7UIP5_ROSNE|nr:hypothetical protein SAMD00023353_0401210 [Rosellinia necatrix]
MQVFSYRMARMPSFLQFLIWSSSIPIVLSDPIGLGGDITSLVPSCAQPCLEAFVRSNYPTSECGTQFTLPCLCPTQSASGLTVGEAALQCLFGYVQLGRCDREDANGGTPARVLHMCSGQENALPNTHSTLTATLVIPPSGDPSLLPPTSSRTIPLTSSTTASARTTKRTSTTTASHTSSPSSSAVITSMVMTSLPTLTPTSSSTSSSISSSTSNSAAGPTSEPSSTTRLAPAQIAGISVGIAGAIAIAVGAILLARCLRRRKYPDSESGKVLFENDNSTGGFDPFDPRGSRIFHISPPVLRTSRYRPEPVVSATPPAQQTIQPEPPVQSPKVDRNTIGLAISRPRSLIPPRILSRIHSPAMSSPSPVEVTLERKPSKLLPPRPALTLDIPSSKVAAGAPSSQGPPTKDRASTLTNMTAFADLDLEAAEGEQTWRPPPTDPLSATTLYVADKYGNWVLSNNHRRSQIAQITQAAELDAYTPLTKSPIEKQEESVKMTATASPVTALQSVPQPTFLSQDPTNWTNSQSSSSYSQGATARYSGRRNSSNRNSVSRARKGNGGPVMNRSDSKASATTIHTSTTGGNGEGPAYENDIARLSQLSPVEESPALVPGRSRVIYPKIPGRLDGATIRYVPPPKRPNFGGLPLEQPSPTLGALYAGEGSPSAYPPPLNPRRNERQLAPIQRNGSGFTPEPELPNVEVYPLSEDSPPEEMSRPRPYQRTGFVSTQPAVQYRYTNSQQQDPFSTPTQKPVATFTPSPLSAEKKPPTPPLPRIMDRGRPHIASQRVESGTSFKTVSSTASSLLIKRVGNDRAAALALDPNAERAQQWRRRGGGDESISPDSFSLASPRGTLPQTPIWQPKLTPTRRGDDLYLNVQ